MTSSLDIFKHSLAGKRIAVIGHPSFEALLV